MRLGRSVRMRAPSRPGAPRRPPAGLGRLPVSDLGSGSRELASARALHPSGPEVVAEASSPARARTRPLLSVASRGAWLAATGGRGKTAVGPHQPGPTCGASVIIETAARKRACESRAGPRAFGVGQRSRQSRLRVSAGRAATRGRTPSQFQARFSLFAGAPTADFSEQKHAALATRATCVAFVGHRGLSVGQRTGPGSNVVASPASGKQAA